MVSEEKPWRVVVTSRFCSSFPPYHSLCYQSQYSMLIEAEYPPGGILGGLIVSLIVNV